MRNNKRKKKSRKTHIKKPFNSLLSMFCRYMRLYTQKVIATNSGEILCNEHTFNATIILKIIHKFGSKKKITLEEVKKLKRWKNGLKSKKRKKKS